MHIVTAVGKQKGNSVIKKIGQRLTWKETG